MKLIFLYGAPGAGKLTVAKELSKLTGFKVFHNHLTVDLVRAISDWGDPEFFALINKYRLDIIERAASSKRIKGLITTFVYGKGSDEKFLAAVVRRVKKHKGQVLFVHLWVKKDELLRRVKQPSRKEFSKIKTHARLKAVMRKHDIFSDVPYKENIRIDNTDITAKRAAALVKKHYRL